MAFDDVEIIRVPLTRDDALACLVAQADAGADRLSFETTVHEWRHHSDAPPLIDDLANGLNERFRMSLTRAAWREALTPVRQRTLGEVCDIIAAHATRPTFRPLTILGSSS